MTDITIINSEVQHTGDGAGSGDITALIDQFLSQLQAVPDTKETYRNSLKQFFGWVSKQGKSLAQLSKADIVAFNQYLLEQEYSVLTANGYLVGIRVFYEYLESVKLYPNIAKGVKPNKASSDHRKEHLTEQQVVQLMGHIQGLPIRDQAIIMTILGGGFRAIEVSRFNLGDISLKGGKKIIAIWGKGRKERDEDGIIVDEVWAVLDKYIKSRFSITPSQPLFISDSNNSMGGRLSTRTISQICKDALTAIGLTGDMYTCHSLRHTTAVLLLMRGASLYEVQQVLRHKSPETTMVYLESIRKQKKLQDATVERLRGLFRGEIHSKDDK